MSIRLGVDIWWLLRISRKKGQNFRDKEIFFSSRYVDGVMRVGMKFEGFCIICYFLLENFFYGVSIGLNDLKS